MDPKQYSQRVENLFEAAVISITRCDELIATSRQLVENSKRLNERCRETLRVIRESNARPKCDFALGSAPSKSPSTFPRET